MNEKQISSNRQTLPNTNLRLEGLQRIYTDKEACDFLRISPVTLWRERKAGKITFRFSGSKLIYTQQDLQNYIERSKTPALAEAAAA